MICFPNCKINLGLFVTEKRKDSYHNLETIFYPVALNDLLEAVKSDKNEFTTSGIDIPGHRESNLILLAYNILRKKYNLPCVKIYLHKIIPIGAGLGGGSADAAFMIKLLNDIFSLGMTKDQMKDIAGQLGSDCAFFIENKPVFATNKGDFFEEIDLDLCKHHLLLVKPDIGISTMEAYSMIKPKKPAISLKAAVKEPINEWKNFIMNDFEECIFEKFPVIKKIKEQLYEYGAVYASMSGSGSAVFGIFEKPIETTNIFKDCYTWLGKLKQNF